jgi:hypothetical protein
VEAAGCGPPRADGAEVDDANAETAKHLGDRLLILGG